MRNEGGGFAEIDDEVAAVLAFVLSHMTLLAAPDDETGQCPKVSGRQASRFGFPHINRHPRMTKISRFTRNDDTGV